MTDIIFPELFKKEISSKFKITEEEVKKTITGPDELKRIPLSASQQILLYLKKLPSGYHLLVDCQLQGTQNRVQNAYKIFPELFDEFGSNEPLVILEKFARKFGLPIRIGGNEEMFIAGESFLVNEGNPQNIVNFSNPSNHDFTSSMMMRVRDEGNLKYVDVSMAYCIDTQEYQKYLSEHSQ